MYDPVYFNLRRNWIPALIGAAASIGSMFGSNALNNSNTKSARKYNTAERIASQEFQTSERESQNKWAEQMYQQYSSPEALYRQYAEAGLNPNLAAGAGNVGSPTSGAGSSGGAPSGPGSFASYMPQDSLIGGIKGVADAFKSLAEAKKQGVETGAISEKLKEELKGMQLANFAQDFTNRFLLPNMKKSQALAVKKAAQDLATGEVSLEQAKEILNGLKKDNILKDNEVNVWFEKYETELANVKSNTAKNYSDINRNSVLNSETAQSIIESRSRTSLNYKNAHKVGLEAKYLEDNLDNMSKELKLRIDGLDVDNRLKVIQSYDSLIGILNYALSGQHEISGDNWQRIRELLDFRGTRQEWIPFLLKNADNIESIREALGVTGLGTTPGTHDQDGRPTFGVK